MAFEPTIARNHWKSEILGFLTPFEGVRVKSGNHSLKAKSYFREIWDGPVEPDGPGYVAKVVSRLAEAKPDLHRNAKTIEDLVEEIKAFHLAIGQAIETGRPIHPIVLAL